ncbi:MULTISPECIES: hypothetical protein [Micrococcaceae]|uniref:hypothetical protein n=1 Tax=Micrococcaceae TaxID=1268 RepID=UPI0020982EFE|nr:hypothetical protein [Paenarthrobacter ureafaciens]MCY0975657.1 hypothetical protein [Paenarthrobacter ureafaciens]MDD1478474.1 hypothetical protein [Arthrobacter sp. H16F315]
MSINKFGFVVAVTAALAGCAAPASETAPATPAITTNIPVEDPGHSEDHGVPAVTWDAATEEKVKALAADLMGKFARPDLTDRAWFNALQPHMSADYQESAQYIDPGRIPVRQIVSGPVLVREKGNPMSVTAEFTTNNGPWVLSLHRTGQDEPWLITNIAPKDS